MKKAIVVLLALAVVGAMAFAQDKTAVTFSGSVEAGALVTATSSSQTIATNDANNGYFGQLAVSASLGDFATKFAFRTTDLATLTVHDAWLTQGFLNNMLTIGAGYDLGSVISTAYEGNGGIGGNGLQVYVMPISGLTLGAFVPLTIAGDTLSNTFQAFKIAAEYTMEKLFTFYAGYDNSANTAEVSLDILAVPNLTAQLEAAISTNGGSTVPEEYLAYAMGNLTASVWASETLGSGSFDFSVKPAISYAMGVPTLGASVKYTQSTSAVVIDANVKFALNDLATLKLDANYDTSSSTTKVGLDMWHSF